MDLTAVFMEECYSLDMVRYWMKEFREGQEQIQDLDRCGRPKTASNADNVEGVVDALQQDKRQTCAQIALKLQISHSSVHRILHKELNMRKKAAKFVPKLLSPANIQSRLTLCRDNLQWYRIECRLFERIITGDESYFHLYLPETKEQSKQWLEKDEPRPQKALRGRGTRASKVMLVIFFDCHGVVHREFIRNATVTAQMYLGILQRLLVSIQHRRTHSWHQGTFILHDDNAPAHRANLVRNWMAQRHIRQLPHPPYSPDLAPADFWFFPKLKQVMRGIRYPDQNVLEFETDRLIGEIPHHEFQEAILRKWPHRMRKCIRKNGQYFEGVQ